MSEDSSVPHPIDPQVRAQILRTLDRIEQERDVRIVYACESGSRGWGFASPDSDYDVRLIYVNRLDWYLRVAPGRDVIELPISDIYDVNGRELRKALGLLRNGNATLIEWLDSPVVYRSDAVFLQGMREAVRLVHQPERSLYHYLHMAAKNYRDHLRGEQVRLKKYLYVLRPLLAALWIEAGRGVAPMPFQQLVADMVKNTALREAIDALVVRKRGALESEYASAVPAINHFIERELERLKAVTINVKLPYFTPLDDLLHHSVTCHNT